MKKINKNSIIPFILALSMFGGAISSIASNDFLKPTCAFDYSKNDDKTTLNPSQLIAKVTNSIVSTDETEYVNTYLSDYSLSYQNNPNKNKVDFVEYKKDLYVYADEYKYKDNNNQSHTWVPKSVTYLNADYYFSKQTNGRYKLIINNYDTLHKDIKVNYDLDLKLNKDSVNTLITSAYDFAYDAYLQNDENERKESEYNTKLQEYEDNEYALEHYDENRRAYDQYVNDLRQYELDNQEYLEYQKKYEQYKKDYSVYDTYLKNKKAWEQKNEEYQAYLAQLKRREENKDIIEQYKSKYGTLPERINYELAAMDIIFQESSQYKRTINWAVRGNAVSSILGRKADIVALGVPSSLVDRSNTATQNLIKLFEEYDSFNDDLTRYNWYVNNWKFLKDNVNELARCLTKLLSYDIVFNLIDGKGEEYVTKYTVLVAQLIYFANAISNEGVFCYDDWSYATGSGKADGTLLDDKFPIRVSKDGKTKLFKEIISDMEFIDYSKASEYAKPLKVDVTQEVLDLLVDLKEVENPGPAPKEVSEPTKPVWKGEVPQAPKKVENPGERPTHFPAPTAPTYISLTDLQKKMAQGFKEGHFVDRNKFTSDVDLTVSDSYETNFGSGLKHLIKFYDTDKRFICEQIFTFGVIFEGKIPTAQIDKEYETYSFDWVDEKGDKIILSMLTESCDAYAKLVPGKFKEYTVTWDIDGVITTQTYHFGDDLIVPEVPKKADANDCYYEFKGWNKAIVPSVIADANYVAQYIERHYTIVNVVVEGKTTSYKYKEGEFTGEFDIPSKPDNGDKYYVFEKWDIIKTDNYHLTYTAVFKELSFFYVTWVVDGQTVLANQKYRHGEAVTYPYATPTRDGDQDYLSYILDYWMDSSNQKVDLETIDNTITLYAHFMGYNTEIYAIYFYVDDQVIASQVYGAGETPIPPVVTKEDDEDYFYTFVSWDKEIVPASSTENYHAVFERHNLYKVNINIEGNVTSQVVHYLEDVVFPMNPIKSATETNSFTFKEWSFATTSDEYHVTYTAIFNTCATLTLYVEDKFTEVLIVVGEPVNIETPVKEANEVYEYVFSGWVNQNNQLVDLSTITVNTVLYATFLEQYIEYEIVWILGNETIIEYYHYGDSVVVPTNLDKNSDDTYYYEFAEWEIEIQETVTDDAVYEAIYTSYNFYIITTVVDDNETTYRFRQDEVINVPNPTKDDDEHHAYEFKRWDIDELSDFEFVYTAIFDVTNYFYVSWMNEGMLLQREKYVEGSRISYKLAIPTKQAEEYYYYLFSGWDINLINFTIHSDVTANAQFEKLNKLTVRWEIGGEVITDYYEPGESLRLPFTTINPYKDNQYIYVFDSWSSPLQNIVMFNAIYVAKYNKTPLATNGRVIYSVIEDNDSLIVDLNHGNFQNIDLGGILLWIKLSGSFKVLKILYNEGYVSVPQNKVMVLANSSVTTLTLDITSDNYMNYRIQLLTYDKDKKISDVDNVIFSILYSSKFKTGKTFLYLNNELQSAIFTDNSFEFNELVSNKIYEIYATYNVNFEQVEGANVVFNKTSARYNEEIEVNVTLENGYELKSLLLFVDGEAQTITNGKFFMPDCDVTLKIELERILYTIEFYVDDVLVYKTTGHYGDLILDPLIENEDLCDKPDSEDFRYVFVGWDSQVGTIDGNKVYHAVFNEIPIEHYEIPWELGIVNTLLIILGGVVLVAGGVVAFIVIKKRKK